MRAVAPSLSVLRAMRVTRRVPRREPHTVLEAGAKAKFKLLVPVAAQAEWTLS